MVHYLFTYFYYIYNSILCKYHVLFISFVFPFICLFICSQMYICVFVFFVISMRDMCLCYIHCMRVMSNLVRPKCWVPNVFKRTASFKSPCFQISCCTCLCVCFYFPAFICHCMSDLLIVYICKFAYLFFYFLFFYFNLFIYFTHLFIFVVIICYFDLSLNFLLSQNLYFLLGFIYFGLFTWICFSGVV